VQRPRGASFGDAGCCVVGPADGRNGSTRAPCGAEDDVVYVRVPAGSTTAQEVWNAGTVAVAPVGLTGRRVGPPVEMAARVLSSEEEERARQAVARTSCITERLRPRHRDYLYLELRPPASLSR